MNYSGWVTYNGYNFFRTGIEVSTSSSNTSVTITVKTYIQLASGSHEGFWNFKGRTNAGGGYTGYVSGSSAYLQDTANHQISSASHTVSRTHANQTISVAGQAYDSYLGTGTGTASSSVTVSPRASYAITYNANGGSSAPAAQTKWYDEAITLQKGVPTRTNYEFLGWSTNKGATAADSAYTKAKMTAGVNYTSNSALTLYAVWKLSAVSPVITKLTAYRSDADGNRVDDATSATTHIKVEYGWSVDTGASSRKIQFSLGGTAQTAITLSANSGTGSVVYAKTLNIDAKLAISATLTDASHGLNVSKVVTVPVIFKPFSMKNKGKAAAFFGIAGAAWDRILHVFGDLYQTKEVPRHYMYMTSHNTQVGVETASSSWTELASNNIYDSAGTQTYYSQLAYETNTTNLYRSYVVRRLNASGTAMMGGFYTYLDSDGTSRLALTGTNVEYGWHQAISTWKQLATAKSGTAMTFTLPTRCTEVMVAARCTSTLSVSGTNVRRYSGSVVIPVALLDTTQTEWLLGGGSVGSTSSASGTRYCAVRITKTSALGVGAHCDGTDYASTTTFYVYTR